MSDAYERLGFLSLNRTESEDGYLGALLVTDANGLPLEFRVTHPVKPTAIQRPLYGDSLEPYIGATLCGKQLFAASERKPQVIIVGSEFMLDVREEVTVPVVLAREAGQAIEIPVEGHDGRPKSRLLPVAGAFKPLMISAHSLDADIFDEIRNHLEDLSAHLDLLEPFKRIEEALKVLAKQDKRFK